jgi:hypothetical protein
MINFADTYTGKKYNFEILKHTDKNIINELLLLNDDTLFKVNSVVVKTLSGKDIRINIKKDLPDELLKIVSIDSESLNVFNITVKCGTSDLTFQILRDHNEKPFDRIYFTGSYDDTDTFDFDILYGELRKRFQAVNSEKTELDEDKKVSEFYLRRESDLSRLEGLAKQLIIDNQNIIKQKESELKDETKIIRDKLENDYKEKNDKIGEREKALEEKQKNIDDRENKHVRREIRKNLKEVFLQYSKDYHLTKGTVRKRFIIHMFSIILLMIFGYGFIYFSILSMDTIIDAIKSGNYQILITLYIKNILFALGFGSTSIFYIRWNNKWFEQHSSEEFKLKKLEIDIERASWIVEMALEWEDNKKEIPVLLIDRLSQNLFNDSKEEDIKLHPADQLASSILGVASGLKMKTPDGSELYFTKNGIKKLSKESNKN